MKLLLGLPGQSTLHFLSASGVPAFEFYQNFAYSAVSTSRVATMESAECMVRDRGSRAGRAAKQHAWGDAF